MEREILWELLFSIFLEDLYDQRNGDFKNVVLWIQSNGNYVKGGKKKKTGNWNDHKSISSYDLMLIRYCLK